MKLSGFKGILRSLDELTPSQFNLLKLSIVKTNTPNKIFSLLEFPSADINCPYCKSIFYKKWGIQSNLQRYKCKSCKRTYNSLSGTHLANLGMKRKWLLFSDCMVKAYSIRKAARICSISNSTSFKWRHRFLQASKINNSLKIRGIIETENQYLLENCKGSRTLNRPARRRGGNVDLTGNSIGHVCLLFCRNRHGDTREFVVRGLSSSVLSSVLKPVLAFDILFCFDKNSEYLEFSKEHNIRYGYIDSKDGFFQKKRIIHLHNVNIYYKILKEWISRFNGVASKYLDNYLAWFRILENTNMGMLPQDMLKISSSRIFINKANVSCIKKESS